jgi:sortase (surface protein transpeptidase)
MMLRALGRVLKAFLLLAVLAVVLIAVGNWMHRDGTPTDSGGTYVPTKKASYSCKPIDSRLHKGAPCRVAIPAIGVDAKVIWLGLNPDGTLQVPRNYSLTGWWSGGQKPGKDGPTVIVGHIDGRSGPAVFYHLKRLQPGDIVKVWRVGMRTPVKYRVVDTGEWPKSDFPTELVYGDTPGPTLRLITCGGAFNHSTGHYVDNIIVFARIVSTN